MAQYITDSLQFITEVEYLWQWSVKSTFIHKDLKKLVLDKFYFSTLWYFLNFVVYSNFYLILYVYLAMAVYVNIGKNIHELIILP